MYDQFEWLKILTPMLQFCWALYNKSTHDLVYKNINRCPGSEMNKQCKQAFFHNLQTFLIDSKYTVYIYALHIITCLKDVIFLRFNFQQLTFKTLSLDHLWSLLREHFRPVVFSMQTPYISSLERIYVLELFDIYHECK